MSATAATSRKARFRFPCAFTIPLAPTVVLAALTRIILAPNTALGSPAP